jgi:hypothetical protein
MESFERVKMSKVPEGVKLIDTTWAMKKKSSGTLCGRVNVRGFKQIGGQHYNGTSISAPVTNAVTIRIVLTIMLMQGGIAHVVDVKGAFLYGKNSRMGRKSISRFHWDSSNTTQAIQFFY